MAAITCVLAPAGVAAGVLDVLTDLSAAGLLARFVWVTDPDEAGPPRVLTRVQDGRATDVTLQEILTEDHIDIVRVCVLVPLVGDVTPLTVGQERYLANLLASSAGGAARTVRVRALLARPGMMHPAQARLGVDGWHNLLIAPEDARGPGLGHIGLPASDSAADIGRHSAPVLAAVLGLWRDIEHAPLDQAPVVPGEVVRLTRSFYRKLETGQAEAELRRQLLSQEGGLPLPNDQRAPVVYVNDVELAAATMADQFWRKHAAILRSARREPERSPGPQKIGVGAALKMFFGFMWAAIKNAPSAWYAAVVDSVSTGIAATVNRTVFGGADAAYEVVVKGRTARGLRADWTDIADASSQLSGALGGEGDRDGEHRARNDLSALWQDYSRAAMTLADAGSRSAELPPIQIGVSRGIISAAADIVPGPAERFTDIPGAVAASIEVESVDATDPLGIIGLRTKLAELERQPEHGLQARSTLTAVEVWQRRHSTSFAGLVGRRLADAFGAAYTEVQELLNKLRQAPDIPAEPNERNARLARWIQVTIALLVLISGATIYLAIADIVKWWATATIIVVTVIISLLLCLRAFMRAQQELFQLLHKRKSAINQREVDEQNLRAALRDLNRLSHGYGEYLAWSRALGAFLAAPLGPNTHRHHQVLRISWGLPLSTSVGYATPGGADLSTTVDYLRRDLFNIGWLSDAWESLVISAQPRPAGGWAVTADSSPLWAQSGRGSGSALDAWSSSLFDGGLTSSGADVTWRRALANLTGPMAQLVDTLVNRVQESGGGTVTAGQFLSQIDQPAPPAGTLSFDNAMLTDFAVTRGAAAVTNDVRVQTTNGVGKLCIATQFSEAIPVDYLTLTAAPPSSVQWDASATTPGGRHSPAASTPPSTDDAYRPPEPEGFRF